MMIITRGPLNVKLDAPAGLLYSVSSDFTDKTWIIDNVKLCNGLESRYGECLV